MLKAAYNTKQSINNTKNLVNPTLEKLLTTYLSTSMKKINHSNLTAKLDSLQRYFT